MRLESSLDGDPPRDTARRAGQPRRLRAGLIALDAATLAAAWGLAFTARPIAGPSGLALAGFVAASGAAGTLAAMGAQGLYRAPACGVRAVEIERLGRAAAIGGGVAFVIASGLYASPRSVAAIAAALALAFVALVVSRGGYRAWLLNRRPNDCYAPEVVLVGTDPEAAELYRAIHDHPKLGCRVVGFIGPRPAGDEPEVPWLGDYEDAVEATRKAGATGAVLVASAMSPAVLNCIAQDLIDAGIRLQISSRLEGVPSRRLRMLPVSHEPLLSLEPPYLLRTRLAMKRALDVLLATVLLVATGPMLLIAALAIKLQDGGPVLFRQQRLGRHERPFTLYKLRTMAPDAERQRDGLRALNRRSDGPLFKASPDPRVTRVGGLLRASGVDELPQLINVIAGTMSLIGPRPALADEVAQFDDELRQRASVRPGITGLWQVEAGHLPQFELYRRLDLYYVKNWSVGLDLGILVATIGIVAVRTLRALPAALGWKSVNEPIVLD